MYVKVITIVISGDIRGDLYAAEEEIRDSTWDTIDKHKSVTWNSMAVVSVPDVLP